VNRLRHRNEGGDLAISGEDVQKLTDILAASEPEPAE
jgi:hypothetical protein